MLERLKQKGFVFKKNLGQNFIFDKNLLQAIVADSSITKDDIVIEIGAGAGTLTEILAKSAKHVISFEVDDKLRPILETLVNQYHNLKIEFLDILKADIIKYVGDSNFKVVANLPYYITTPVIFHLLEQEKLQSLTVMVQKEVAERFVARNSTASYGAVTAQLAAYGNARITRVVSKQMFIPAPNVDSAVVRLDIHKKQGIKNFAVLQKLIAASFAMRRKTLVNNLIKGFSFTKEQAEELLSKVGLDMNTRGEALDIYKFIELSNLM